MNFPYSNFQYDFKQTVTYLSSGGKIGDTLRAVSLDSSPRDATGSTHLITQPSLR